jgi:superfamily II DNA helicase RecQ
LAKHPPTDPSALADVPGVGGALAERFGGTILRALSSDGGDVICRPDNAAFDELARWRSGVARSMGVPAYRILGNGVLRAICQARPRNKEELARIKGVGPRVLAKFGNALVELSTNAS